MKLASNLGSKVNLFASGFTSVLGKDARACPKFAALLKLVFLDLAHLQKSNSFSFPAVYLILHHIFAQVRLSQQKLYRKLAHQDSLAT